MIGSVRGTVSLRDNPYLFIDVQGVGYKILVPSSVFSESTVGKSLTLFTYLHVREDILELYGFSSIEDLKLFEKLVSVSGIGPKTALGVFAVGSRSDIISAIMKADTLFFQGVPRLGKKNAQKLIIELKNKFGSVSELNLQEENGGDEVMVALQSFGFSQKESIDALKAISGQGETTSQKVKLALKYLGK